MSVSAHISALLVVSKISKTIAVSRCHNIYRESQKFGMLKLVV
jgi:hypothetical protein